MLPALEAGDLALLDKSSTEYYLEDLASSAGRASDASGLVFHQAVQANRALEVAFWGRVASWLSAVTPCRQALAHRAERLWVLAQAGDPNIHRSRTDRIWVSCRNLWD
jgi:hypothetical protein